MNAAETSSNVQVIQNVTTLLARTLANVVMDSSLKMKNV
jgi:hypothetical protein